MAVVYSKLIMEALRDWLATGAAKGMINSSSIGEPKAVPVGDVHASVLLSAMVPTGTTLKAVIELRTYLIRVYIDAFQNPEHTEITMDEICHNLWVDLNSQIRFEGLTGVRSIEPLGSGIQFGFEQLQEKWFRIGDVEIAVTVDDSATFAGD